MTTPRLLLAALVRAAACAVLFVALDASYERTDLSTDALGLGLLLIAAALVVSFVWATIDGVRRGFAAALGLWALSTVLIGLGIGLLAARDVLVDPGSTTLLEAWVATVVAVALPALLGVGLGGIVHRVRRPG